MLKPRFRGSFIFGMPVTELSTALLWKLVHTSTYQKIEVDNGILIPSWNVPVTWDCGNMLDADHHSRVLWIDIDGNPCTDDDLRLKGSTRTVWEQQYSEITFSTCFFEVENPDALFLHPVAPEDCRDNLQLLAPWSNLLTLEVWVASLVVSRGCDELGNSTPADSFHCREEYHDVCALTLLGSNVQLAGYVDVPQAVSPTLLNTGIFIALSRTCITTGDIVEDKDKHVNEPPSDDGDIDLIRTTTVSADRFSAMTSWNGSAKMPWYENANKYFEDHPEEEPPTAFGIVANHGLDHRVYDFNKPWCLYDVMMIEERDGVAYRLGVGTCHIDAFHQAGAVWKRIQLG